MASIFTAAAGVWVVAAGPSPLLETVPELSVASDGGTAALIFAIAAVNASCARLSTTFLSSSVSAGASPSEACAPSGVPSSSMMVIVPPFLQDRKLSFVSTGAPSKMCSSSQFCQTWGVSGSHLQLIRPISAKISPIPLPVTAVTTIARGFPPSRKDITPFCSWILGFVPDLQFPNPITVSVVWSFALRSGCCSGPTITP